MADWKPAVPGIVIGDGQDLYVEAMRCSLCDAHVTRQTLACPSCGKRGTLESYRVAGDGTLHSYSIVHRSYPSVEVPFVSAIVDMTDGTVLKGNLRKVDPTPDALRFDMPVRLVLDDAGRTDAEGNRYISYFFEPA